MTTGEPTGQRHGVAKPEQAVSALRQSSGRDRDEWFDVLDGWGAAGRPYREIADWLVGHHRISNWWAQKLIVEYEQARGIRPAGVRPDGTFTVTVSKTVAAPVERVFELFVDPSARQRWLPGATMRERTSRASRSARFDWEDGATRVNVTFTARQVSGARAGERTAKTEVAVEHERLSDPAAADAAKSFWRRRMDDLKTLLEEESG